MLVLVSISHAALKQQEKSNRASHGKKSHKLDFLEDLVGAMTVGLAVSVAAATLPLGVVSFLCRAGVAVVVLVLAGVCAGTGDTDGDSNRASLFGRLASMRL